MREHRIQIFVILTIVLFSNFVSALPEGPPTPGKQGGPGIDETQTQKAAVHRDSPPIVPTPLHRIGPYSEKKAVLLSALSTGLSIALGGGLMMGGLLGDVSGLTWTGAGILTVGGAVGPSLGYFYIKKTLYGSLMTALRIVLIGAAVIPRIAYQAVSESMVTGLRASAHALVVIPLTSLLALVSAITDLLTVRRFVRRANDSYRRERGISW